MIARTMAGSPSPTNWAWGALWICVLAALPLAAQTEAPVSPAPVTPSAEVGEAGWVGVLTGTNVYVRSGPGEQAYPCTKLSTPDEVTVVGRTDGWLRIVAPKGCFSVIGKAYVQPDQSGTKGTLTGDNVWVRAGGDLRTSNFIGVQRQMSKGDTVQIIGEAGEFYKIVPPDGAYFYISQRYVRRPGEQPTPEMELAGEMEAASMPALTTRPATTRPAPAGPANVTAFKAAEKMLMDEFAKPVEQRELKKLLATYQAIPLSADDPLKPYVDARVKFLNISLEELADLAKVKELARTTAEKQREYESMLAKLELEVPPPSAFRTPAAIGVLMASKVYPGMAAIGKRYLICDPQTGKVQAYVQSSTGAVDLDRYIGLLVEVYGEKKMDRQLLRYVVEVNEVVVLGPGQGPPPPPKPEIRIKPPTSRPAELTAPAPAPPEEPAPPATAPASGLPVVKEPSAPAVVNEEEYR